MTIDPSAHHGDPVGEAFSHTSQKAAQFISMAGAAYEIAARRKAIRASKEAARTQQQLQAAQEQDKALRMSVEAHARSFIALMPAKQWERLTRQRA